MNSLNFVVLGDTSIVNDLGKKGTSSDISIYDRKTNDQVISYCFSNTYPEKLQSLLQSIAMSDYAILNISQLDSFLGEQIIALDIFNIRKGFILYSYEIDVEKIKNIIKNTNLSNYQILGSIEELKSCILKLQSESDQNGNEGQDNKENKISNDISSNSSTTTLSLNTKESSEDFVYIPIDHVFDVKGVGTVILGCIRQGEIKIYDELELSPLNKLVVIKSIQMHDDPVPHSKKPSRVGLAIKGVSAKEISRGDFISSPGISKTIDSNFQIKFYKNPYFKGDIIETQNYMISVGLQTRTVKIKKNEKSDLLITLEKPISYIKNDLCIVFSPDAKSMRIIGYGKMD
ncbi:MAG: EF-Tu/IF-2/RF-3 family GTPase [Candidatus Nitrosocosmicus sp.]